MRRHHFIITIAALACSLGWAASGALAQNATDPGARGDQQGMSKEERMYASLREALEVTDDAEWRALAPKIARVSVLTRQARDLRDPKRTIERFRSFKSQDANGQPAPYYLQDLADRAAEVRDVWDDKSAHPNQIIRALKAFRDARAKADKELSEELLKARGEL